MPTPVPTEEGGGNTAENGAADENKPIRTGKCCGPGGRFWQQEMASSSVPLWFYGWKGQTGCSLCLAIFCLVIGALFISTASGVKEVIVKYDHTNACVEDSSKNCYIKVSVPEDIGKSGDPAYMYYELPDIFVNHKTYVESKQHAVFGSVYSIYKCENALTIKQAKDKRKIDTAYGAMIGKKAGVKYPDPEEDLAPCGFSAVAMFTDTYALYKSDITQTDKCLAKTKDECGKDETCVWGGIYNLNEATIQAPISWSDSAVKSCKSKKYDAVNLDESEVALTSDTTILEKSVVPASAENKAKGIHWEIEKKDETVPSWLGESPKWLQHFLVWMRSPASPFVRNLWAKIDGGLPKGDYTLHITHNSPIWTTQWLVPEKRIVFSTATTFGGSSTFLGIIYLLIGVYCVLSTFFFLAAPKIFPKKEIKRKNPFAGG